MNQPDERRAPEVLAEGKYLRLLKQGRWEYAERTNTTGAAALVAVTDDGRLLLAEQFRAPLGKRCVELPAGPVGDDEGDAGEELLAAAKRELREEAGYEAADARAVAVGAPSAGMGNEIVTLVLATGLKHVTDDLGDGAEDIQLHA